MTEIDSIVIKFISAYIKSQKAVYSLKNIKKEDIQNLIEENSICYKPFCEQNRKQENKDLVIIPPLQINNQDIAQEKKNFYLGKKTKAKLSTNFWGKVLPILFKKNILVNFLNKRNQIIKLNFLTYFQIKRYFEKYGIWPKHNLSK